MLHHHIHTIMSVPHHTAQVSWLTWQGVQAAWNLIMGGLTMPWPYNPFNP